MDPASLSTARSTAPSAAMAAMWKRRAVRATSVSRGPRPASVQSITDARSPATITLSGWKSPWHTTAGPSSARWRELLGAAERRRQVRAVEVRDDLPGQAQAVVDHRRGVRWEAVGRQGVQPEREGGELVHQPARPPRLGADRLQHRRAWCPFHHLRREVEPIVDTEHGEGAGRRVPASAAHPWTAASRAAWGARDGEGRRRTTSGPRHSGEAARPSGRPHGCTSRTHRRCSEVHGRR